MLMILVTKSLMYFLWLTLLAQSIYLKILFGLNSCGVPFQGDDPYFNKLIRILTTRCMSQVIEI